MPRHIGLSELETDAGDLNIAASAAADTDVRSLPISGDDLVDFLARTRKGYNTPYHDKSVRAARKDARIIELLAAGYTNFGIAQELGTSADAVRARLQKAPWSRGWSKRCSLR